MIGCIGRHCRYYNEVYNTTLYKGYDIPIVGEMLSVCSHELRWGVFECPLKVFKVTGFKVAEGGNSEHTSQ